MLILFDHGTRRSIARLLHGHTVVEAMARGWDRLTNGALWKAAEEAGSTSRYPQTRISGINRTKGRRIAIVVLGNSQRPAVHCYIDQVVAAVNAVSPGSYAEVDILYD